ncbi:long-chain-fatty-acid- ligase [Moniliophthora roreri MCA 2997]|uniref:Long-chain-fatty-acid-ligase n=1 Tax=Moniliophthora roreri (strain MCA 2997) TaxID=1381753 RepID=V2YMC5_MONRO|nr:long-chain-fatty-acid- ligase [Moniliophthora roreri MCA 2997]
MPLVKDQMVPFPADKPLKKQSVEVPGTKRPGQTGHYRNALWGLRQAEQPNAFLTLPQIFDTGLKIGREHPLLGHRPLLSKSPLKFADKYVWESWGRVDERRRALGSALHLLFQKGELGGGEFETVGVWSANRPEWQILDLALQAYAKVAVSIYDTLGKDVVEYIVDHSHLTVVFTTSDHIPTLLRLKPKVPVLKTIVSIDDLSSETKKIFTEWGQTVDTKILEMREVEALGQANLIEPIPARPEQLASICYTSGTTSMPKGALLTHGNMALAVTANMYGLDLPDNGCLISYLPLAHIYGRCAELCLVACGGRIGYWTGDPLRLLEDCQILKPNFFPSVPRVLNRIYQAANAAGDLPGLKGMLFKKAVQAKLERLRATGEVTHAFWDRLVFRKVRAVLGGELALVVSGSAPINPEVIDFLKIALACDVLEGEYGMTENAATIAKSWPGDPTAGGSVGPPQVCNEVKLVDVPAMNYTSEDKPHPRGELCVMGPNVIAGYYKDEKNTKEAIDDEGWFHTGDVAEIDDCGRIRIIDRVKNIMKLAQGEYVALEKIENTYSACPAAAQLYVHGDSLQSYLIAVVVADPVYLANIASQTMGTKIGSDDVNTLGKACEDERIVNAFMKELAKEAKRNGLKGFETVKRIHITLDPFTVDDGTLTPTMKIRRKDAFNKFKVELTDLYARGEPSSESSSKL